MPSQKYFNEIYKEFAQGIQKLCLSYTGDVDQAKDVLQETFIAVWQNMDNFRNDSKLSTWIYRIAINKCLMSIQKQKKMEHNNQTGLTRQQPNTSTLPNTLGSAGWQQWSALCKTEHWQALLKNGSFEDRKAFSSMLALPENLHRVFRRNHPA